MKTTPSHGPSFKLYYNKPTICQKSISDNDFFRKKKNPPKPEETPTSKLNIYA